MVDFDIEQDPEDFFRDMLFFKLISEEERKFLLNALKDFKPDKNLEILIEIIRISDRWMINNMVELEGRIKQLEEQ